MMVKLMVKEHPSGEIADICILGILSDDSSKETSRCSGREWRVTRDGSQAEGLGRGLLGPSREFHVTCCDKTIRREKHKQR